MPHSMDADLRRQIRLLVSARDKLNENLKQIELQSKGIYIKPTIKKKSHDDINNKKGLAGKRNHGRHLNFGDKKNGKKSLNRDSDEDDLDDSDSMDTTESRPKLDGIASQGQKRIMSLNILGHLKKAKNQLDYECTTEKNKKQKEVESIVEDKLRNEKERIELEVAKDFESKRSYTLNKLEEIQKQLNEKEDQLLKIKLIEHHKELSVFIQTKTKPPILWLPNKMNESTNALLEDSKQYWQEKIDQIEIRFSQPEDVEMEM